MFYTRQRSKKCFKMNDKHVGATYIKSPMSVSSVSFKYLATANTLYLI